MQFIQEKNTYKAVKITGPKHHFLGLSFKKDDVTNDNIEMVKLPVQFNEKNHIYADSIKEQVMGGVKEINGRLNTNYKVEKIYYIPSDSPDKKAYKELAEEIILRLHKGGIFNS
ncbi:MAG TPA: hypothetical protein VJB02_03305 [Coxiellaceae bacterium]|nr:hypothetical protein [Coxiellaceae bacterium]